MAKKVRGLNLQGIYKGRNLIVSHKDLDGVMSAAIATFASESSQKDVVVYTDISPKTDKTDEIIREAIQGLKTLSMAMFDEIFILDRATCSTELLEELYNLGVKKVTHIDHHVTNEAQSDKNQMYMYRKYDNYGFYSIFRNDKGQDYSASYLAYKYFISYITNLDTKAFKVLRNYSILADLYDTFTWTKFVTMETEDVNKFIYARYNTNIANMLLYTQVSPFDVRPVNMNYIYKFMEDEDFYNEILECIKSGVDIQKTMKPVVKKFTRIEEDTVKFIQYAYNDARRDNGNSKYDSAIYNMVQEKEDGTIQMAEVLFVDKPLDYGACSVASYRFLVNNPNVILVFRSKEPSYSYSVRSIGDISTLDISTKLSGGGHLNASGFTLAQSKELYDKACSDAKKQVKQELLDIASNTIKLLEK